MDKLFLNGLLGRRAPAPATSPSGSPGAKLGNASAAAAVYSSSALYGSSASSSAAALSAAGTYGLPGAQNALFSALYGGRPPEQLMFDANTCDLVLLVSDEAAVAKAVPVHKEVLRARNPGGYFARLLADPSSFPEYSDVNAITGSGGPASMGPMAGKAVIRRTQWTWPLTQALLGFIYRDCCEVTWAELPTVRHAADEIGLTALVEAVDYLLDPQHLLPWTAADLRAAGVALRRHALVEAADRYVAAMRSTGVDETTRLASFVYHARQARPKFASGLGPGGGMHRTNSGGGPLSPGDQAPSPSGLTRSGSSFSSRLGPNAAAGAAGAMAAANGGGTATVAGSCYRDSRLGLDVIDGVLRSVATDSRVLRGLLLAGRRKEYVLLAGPAFNAGGAGPMSGGSGPGGGGSFTAFGRARRLSSLVISSGSAVSPHGPTNATSPHRQSPTAANGALRPSSPYGGGRPGSPHGSGAASPFGFRSLPSGGGGSGSNRGSLELPLLSSRLRGTTGAANGPGGGGGSPTAQSPTGNGAGEDNMDPWDALELMVIVPANRLTAAMAVVVDRQLDSHAAPTSLVPTASGGYNGGASAASVASGAAGQAGARRGSMDVSAGGLAGLRAAAGSGGSFTGPAGASLALSSSLFAPSAPLSPSAAGAAHRPASSLTAALSATSGTHASPHLSAAAGLPPTATQLPSASQLGQFDQITLALALDCTANGTIDPGTAGAAGARLLGSVLATLAAMDQAHFVVRTDPVAAAQAASFERRRASVDLSPLHGLAGLLGGGTHMPSATPSKAIIGPASPRDYYIPLPDHPGGALSIVVPVGLVMVDPAVLEAAASGATSVPHSPITPPTGNTTPGGLGSGPGGEVWNASFAAGSARPDPSETGSIWGGGGGGGSTMGLAAAAGSGSGAARVAALVPHMMASASALSQLISAVAMINQVLRVAGEQHGVFSSPPLRASLRIANPSQAMLAALAATNCYYAVEPRRQAVYVRKPAGDVVRLLQALQATLPVKSRGSNGSMAPSEFSFGGAGGAGGHGHSAGPDMGISVVARGRHGAPDSYHSLGGPGGGAAGAHAKARSSMDAGRRGSMDVRPGTPLGGPAGGGGGAGALRAGMARASFDLPRGGGGPLGGAPGSVIGGLSYSHGVPYSQLERLFPGWHMHVVELSPPGVMVDEF
ncbi:hypothetical protein HYH03_009238 [Edaphochlamys debaryana]|uniref:BTB domain-containing protein n=1 Tax=Edaphochlamys debaryana TaxID=47281 RepID=A0A835XZP9_9CHLO|nr:hypothetical protein HYH03_009238 [Edaphochlamys debaryana]|eukprot:KAG2492577.1 hypothetical protein HYH03_009238 [Edaphochlamys debaryana]